MRRWLPPLLILLFLAWPFLTHWAAGRGLGMVFPWVLAALLLWRSLREPRRRRLWAALALALVGGGVWLGEAVARWVPAVTFLLLAGIFGRTLRHPPPLVERMVRLQFPDIPPRLVVYLRRLTWVWTGFFIAAAMVSVFLTVTGQARAWLWFHGIGVWSAMAVLLGGEYLYRRRRFPELDRAPPPHETFRALARHGKDLWLD